MSLTRQMVLLIAGLLLLACGGTWLAQLGSLQETLRSQLGLRNAEAATMLAQNLSQLHGDEAAMREALQKQFGLASYQRVALRGRDGQLLAELRAPMHEDEAAPAWFVEWLSLNVESARAQVSDQGRAVADVHVQTRRDWALHALWQSALQTAGWLAGLAIVGLALALWRLRQWQRPLKVLAEQAQALEEGRFQFAEEPRGADLKPVVQSMNSLVSRLADQYAGQSAQVNTLQRLAHSDTVTGLSRREAFLRRVGAFSELPECLGLTLLMLRLKNLALLNEMAGHGAVDSFLGAVGDLLDDYPRRVNGALAGRLNGTDLAVFLPAKGVARETGQALCDTVTALAERSLPGLEFAIGVAETVGAMPLAELLAACDMALAQAEWRSQGRAPSTARGDVVVRLLGPHEEQAASEAAQTPGGRGWRTRISAALDAGRVSVGEYPVVDRHGELLHMECPLRVQPEAEGPVLPAREWLPWASRSALLPRLELAGLSQVLQGIALDGRRRSMHLCESSIVQSGAVQAITAVLDDHDGVAPLLCLEIAESTWARAPAPLAALGAALRARGVEIGLEHAGGALPSKAFVQGIALAYVKIDSRFVRQANTDATARDLALAMIQQARSLGALAIAEGVSDANDIQGLLSLGFDGVTGPGVQLRA